MPFALPDLGIAVSRLREHAAALEQELNAADAKLGDGDTGTMLARLIASLAAQDLVAVPDVGTGLRLLASAAAQSTGSSLGTLLATGLLAAAKMTKGETQVEWGRLAEILAAARDAMAARGGAKLGDKTVLDSLEMIVGEVRGASDVTRIRERAVAGALAALERFRNEPCRMGRARMFGDRSIGVDDPGMLAIARLTEAVAARLPRVEND